MPYVTTETLKESLTEFRTRGDLRWALKSEIPDDSRIEEIIERLLGAGLTEDEIAEILSYA